MDDILEGLRREFVRRAIEEEWAKVLGKSGGTPQPALPAPAEGVRD